MESQIAKGDLTSGSVSGKVGSELHHCTLTI